MRIISQDRNHSVDFENAYIWKQTTHIYAYVGKKDVVLGHYEDAERAEEVFRDIHNAYCPVDLITTNMTEEQIKTFVGSRNISAKVIGLDDTDSEITLMQNSIYFMPEK